MKPGGLLGNFMQITRFISIFASFFESKKVNLHSLIFKHSYALIVSLTWTQTTTMLR